MRLERRLQRLEKPRQAGGAAGEWNLRALSDGELEDLIVLIPKVEDGTFTKEEEVRFNRMAIKAGAWVA